MAHSTPGNSQFMSHGQRWNSGDNEKLYDIKADAGEKRPVKPATLSGRDLATFEMLTDAISGLRRP